MAAKSIARDGNQGDFLAAVGRPADSHILDAFVKQFHNQGQGQFEIETFTLAALTGNVLNPQDALPFANFMRSDHAVFWMAGIPAIFLTDTGK